MIHAFSRSTRFVLAMAMCSLIGAALAMGQCTNSCAEPCDDWATSVWDGMSDECCNEPTPAKPCEAPTQGCDTCPSDISNDCCGGFDNNCGCGSNCGCGNGPITFTVTDQCGCSSGCGGCVCCPPQLPCGPGLLFAIFGRGCGYGCGCAAVGRADCNWEVTDNCGGCPSAVGDLQVRGEGCGALGCGGCGVGLGGCGLGGCGLAGGCGGGCGDIGLPGCGMFSLFGGCGAGALGGCSGNGGGLFGGCGSRLLSVLHASCLGGCGCSAPPAGEAFHCGMPAPQYPCPFHTPHPTAYTHMTYAPLAPHNSLPHYRGTYSFKHGPGLSRTNVKWRPTKVCNAIDRVHHIFEIAR